MIIGMFVRLVGLMSTVVHGPFDDLADWVRDGVVEGLSAAAQKFVDAMTAWATWAIRVELKIYGSDLLPDAEQFLEGPFAVLLGASYGLGVMIIRILIVLAVLVTIVAVARRRQTELATRTISSAVTLILFALLFFPVYTLIVGLVVDGSTAALRAASDGSSNDATSDLTENVVALLMPGNAFLQLVSGVLNGIFSTFTITELAAIVMGTGIVAFFYPLNVAARPLGTFGLNQFKFATAVMVTIPLSIVLMVFLRALQLVVIEGANELVPFAGGFATLIISFVFGLLVMTMPVLVFVLAYSKVTETFGNAEVKIQSGIDVMTMPEVSTRQIGRDASQEKQSYVRQFASELPGAIAAGENDPGTEAKELGKQIAIQAATKSGNPVLMAGGVAYTAVKVVSNVNKPKPEGGESRE